MKAAAAITVLGVSLGGAGLCETATVPPPNAAELDALVKSYPDFLAGHDEQYLYWRDGERMPVSDGITGKSFDAKLRSASILDQMSISYPRGDGGNPSVNFDPGRLRNEAFFRKMYGDCGKAGFSQRLVAIKWLPLTWGKLVQVTAINGVAKHLEEISDEIELLPPNLKRAAYPIAGVLACRPVADTGKMSMHGYAAAIDLNLSYSDYWLWNRKDGQLQYRNRMPHEVVEIFERHGFIWGGRWYHYDTMHFEYRPELLQ